MPSHKEKYYIGSADQKLGRTLHLNKKAALTQNHIGRYAGHFFPLFPQDSRDSS